MDFRGWTVRHAVAVAAAHAAVGLLGVGSGCKSLGIPDSRLMSCKTDADCKAADPKKPACANLRCVECAYDTDCESGVCTDNRCKALFKADADSGPEGPPQNLDACLSRCNDDQACVNKCNDQFRPVEPAPK